MTNPLKERADELGLGPSGIVYEMARRGRKISEGSVRAWFTGAALPRMTMVDDLAAILKWTRAKVLDAMHEIGIAVQKPRGREAAAAAK